MLQPYRPLPAARQIGCVPRPSPRIAAFAARMSPLVTNRRAARADARIRRVPPRSRTIPRAHARHDPRAHLPQMRRPTPRNSTFGAHPTHPHSSRIPTFVPRNSTFVTNPRTTFAANATTHGPHRQIRRKPHPPTFVTNPDIRATKVDIRHECPHHIRRMRRLAPPNATFGANVVCPHSSRIARFVARKSTFVTNPHRVCGKCCDSGHATRHWRKSRTGSRVSARWTDAR